MLQFVRMNYKEEGKMMDPIDILISKAKGFIRDVFCKTDKAHDYLHSIRVFDNAKNILAYYPQADKEIVLLAAILHDVADEKLFQDSSLLDLWFKKEPSQKEENIRAVVSEISYKKGKPGTSIESKIVQDADRLDAIGAIGIARVFTYGGAINRPIYDENNEVQTSLMHFDEKLFHIKEKMNTDVGRMIAEQRDAFMHSFVTELLKEVYMQG